MHLPLHPTYLCCVDNRTPSRQPSSPFSHVRVPPSSFILSDETVTPRPHLLATALGHWAHLQRALPPWSCCSATSPTLREFSPFLSFSLFNYLLCIYMCYVCLCIMCCVLCVNASVCVLFSLCAWECVCMYVFVCVCICVRVCVMLCVLCIVYKCMCVFYMFMYVYACVYLYIWVCTRVYLDICMYIIVCFSGSTRVAFIEDPDSTQIRFRRVSIRQAI